MTHLLLTGFTTFADVTVNPAQLIVETVAAQARPGVVTAVLPVAYHAASAELLRLMALHQPAVVICLGVARGRNAITPERFALNINDASLPDNEGDHPQGRAIIPDAPAAYCSTLPLPLMESALQAAGIPVRISNHAGTYVCNHIFYSLCHAMAGGASTKIGGFIHVPPLGVAGDAEGLPLETLQRGIDLCLEICLQQGQIG